MRRTRLARRPATHGRASSLPTRPPWPAANRSTQCRSSETCMCLRRYQPPSEWAINGAAAPVLFVYQALRTHPRRSIFDIQVKPMTCNFSSARMRRGVALVTAAFWLSSNAARAAESASEPSPLLLTTNSHFHIEIPMAALGKEYLMAASVIPQATAATSTGLAGKIVRFELFHDGVDLYESTKGLVVTDDLPARRLLTTFPIVEQDERKVVIDFNRGMRRVFTEIWHNSGSGFDSSAKDRSLEVPQSRVFAADVRDPYLVIRQSVQTRDRASDANVEAQYEVRYFFSAYVSSEKSGKEQSAAETRYARFFETAPQLEPTTGRQSGRMARFNLNKPVVIHYSANTPKDYTEALRDGIVYWNRAFGRDVIQAELAPDGVTAPDSRYNLVQWVPWDNASYAYADVLIDPRTGDSRHGQAYMTSVFALSGKARVRAALRSMRDLVEKKGNTKLIDAYSAFASLETANACRMDPTEFAQQYAQGLEELLASDTLTDQAVLRASQDYVREVVAHEVGHVLGLRHNFAGSLAATLTARELDDWFKDYLIGKNLDRYTNQIASTSMMEYSPFKAAVFTGWKMRTSHEALPHDKAAIQWGYFDSKEPVEKKMLFGTDQDVARYGDVQHFDYGNEPIVAAYGQLATTLRTLPNSIVEQFIAAKSPRDPRDHVPLAQVNLNVKAHSSAVVKQFASILGWFDSKARSLRVENEFDFVGDLNQEARLEAHWKGLTNQIDKLGGVDRVLFSYIPAELKLELKDLGSNGMVIDRIQGTNLQARLAKLLESAAYTNFVGLDEKKASFSPEEKALILRRGETFFAEFEKEVLHQICSKLEDAPRNLGLQASKGIAEADPVARLEQRIVDLARIVLSAKDESRRIKGKVDKSMVEVADFRYDHETRMAAAKALNDKTGSYRSWAVDAKGELNKSLKDDVDGALNVANFKEFKDSNLSRPLREWYLRQQEILALLPAKPASASK
ncbi:MAG: hypothetical protein EXS36_11045 [Pedosphaera sp.]|nr:hypothetical protein [Pedosphaera sp.]